jgi:hypothetical protein
VRWIRTTNGDRAHAVLFGGQETTLCGIHLSPHAVEIITLGPSEAERCANCDVEWRRKGRLKQPRRLKRDLTVYRPRYTLDDWEKL